MKYLKSFESLDSPQYEIIEYEQFTNEFHKLINFSCMDKMLKLLKPFDIDRDYEVPTFYNGLWVTRGSFTFKITFHKNETEDVDMDIYEMNDEWFFVRLDPRSSRTESQFSVYYKCDQWDGVVQLLKDKKILK